MVASMVESMVESMVAHPLACKLKQGIQSYLRIREITCRSSYKKVMQKLCANVQWCIVPVFHGITAVQHMIGHGPEHFFRKSIRITRTQLRLLSIARRDPKCRTTRTYPIPATPIITQMLYTSDIHMAHSLHTPSLSLSLTLTDTHTHTHTQTLTKTQIHTHTHTHTHTHRDTHTETERHTQRENTNTARNNSKKDILRCQQDSDMSNG